MKLKSQWSARIVVLLCLALGTTSWLYGQRVHAGLEDLQSQASSLASSTKEAEAAQRQMFGSLDPDSDSPTLSAALSETLIEIMKDRTEYGVTVSSVLPQKSTGGAGSAPLSKLQDPVPSTKVNSVRVNVRGSYTDYEGFLHYIQAVRKLPVSVVYMKIDGQGFLLGLRVYGN